MNSENLMRLFDLSGRWELSNFSVASCDVTTSVTGAREAVNQVATSASQSTLADAISTDLNRSQSFFWSDTVDESR